MARGPGVRGARGRGIGRTAWLKSVTRLTSNSDTSGPCFQARFFSVSALLIVASIALVAAILTHNSALSTHNFVFMHCSTASSCFAWHTSSHLFQASLHSQAFGHDASSDVHDGWGMKPPRSRAFLHSSQASLNGWALLHASLHLSNVSFSFSPHFSLHLSNGSKHVPQASAYASSYAFLYAASACLNAT